MPHYYNPQHAKAAEELAGRLDMIWQTLTDIRQSQPDRELQTMPSDKVTSRMVRIYDALNDLSKPMCAHISIPRRKCLRLELGRCAATLERTSRGVGLPTLLKTRSGTGHPMKIQLSDAQIASIDLQNDTNNDIDENDKEGDDGDENEDDEDEDDDDGAPVTNVDSSLNDDDRAATMLVRMGGKMVEVSKVERGGKRPGFIPDSDDVDDDCVREEEGGGVAAADENQKKRSVLSVVIEHTPRRRMDDEKKNVNPARGEREATMSTLPSSPPVPVRACTPPPPPSSSSAVKSQDDMDRWRRRSKDDPWRRHFESLTSVDKCEPKRADEILRIANIMVACEEGRMYAVDAIVAAGDVISNRILQSALKVRQDINEKKKLMGEEEREKREGERAAIGADDDDDDDKSVQPRARRGYPWKRTASGAFPYQGRLDGVLQLLHEPFREIDKNMMKPPIGCSTVTHSTGKTRAGRLPLPPPPSSQQQQREEEEGGESASIDEKTDTLLHHTVRGALLSEQLNQESGSYRLLVRVSQYMVAQMRDDLLQRMIKLEAAAASEGRSMRRKKKRSKTAATTDDDDGGDKTPVTPMSTKALQMRMAELLKANYRRTFESEYGYVPTNADSTDWLDRHRLIATKGRKWRKLVNAAGGNYHALFLLYHPDLNENAFLNLRVEDIDRLIRVVNDPAINRITCAPGVDNALTQMSDDLVSAVDEGLRLRDEARRVMVGGSRSPIRPVSHLLRAAGYRAHLPSPNVSLLVGVGVNRSRTRKRKGRGGGGGGDEGRPEAEEEDEEQAPRSAVKRRRPPPPMSSPPISTVDEEEGEGDGSDDGSPMAVISISSDEDD